MLVDEVVSHLEMTAQDQLRPGRPAPQPMRVEKQNHESWKLLSDTFIRIGDFVGKGFQTRRVPPWTKSEWHERMSAPGVTPWLFYVNDEVAGFLEIEAHADDVEIFWFGLVPKFIGKGFGGEALTLAIETAWSTPTLDEVTVRQVWLHTSTRDHASALPNYERRGFKVFHTENRQREVSLKYKGQA